MKKFFYILASAIVALGAVACENEALDNVNPDNNVKGEGLTITATIDEATKVAFEGLTPSWEEGDKLVIGEYEFTFTEGNNFTCEKEGVFSLCDGTKKEITAGEFNSSEGIDGSAWAAQSVIEREGTVVELQLVTALLKVTAAADNTVLKSVMFSNEEDVALTKGVETYVPIWRGDNTTVTYFVDGIECKSLTKNFEAGKIYNLGTLNPDLVYLKPNSDWKSASATFKAYFFGNAGFEWVNAVDGNKDGTYTALVPSGDYANIIFCRMNPSGTDADMWKNVWGQTQDMVVSIGDTCGIAGWNSGVWKTEWNNDNVYLNSMINGDWKTANHFAAWTWPDGSEGSWVEMEKTAKSGLYVVAKSKLKANVIFTAQKNATSSWTVNKQTGNLKTATTNANIYDVNNSAWVTATF